MRTLVTPEGMYALERRCFSGGTPSIALMRRAADRLAEAFQTHFGAFAGESIAVACGRGNNGGDGYAFSVLAARAGARVTLLTACDTSALRGDALTCAREAFALNIPRLSADRLNEIARPDVWVDALFGIGLNRPLDAFYAALINRVNRDHAAGSRVMAIDAPSGLNLTSGRMMGACVAADVTVTFEYAKTGHYLADGLDQCGLIDARPLETGLAPDEPIRLIEPCGRDRRAARAPPQHPQGIVRPSADRRGIAGHGRSRALRRPHGAAHGRGAGHAGLSALDRAGAANARAGRDGRFPARGKRRDQPGRAARAQGRAARQNRRRRRAGIVAQRRPGNRGDDPDVRPARRDRRGRAQSDRRKRAAQAPAQALPRPHAASGRGRAAHRRAERPRRGRQTAPCAGRDSAAEGCVERRRGRKRPVSERVGLRRHGDRRQRRRADRA